MSRGKPPRGGRGGRGFKTFEGGRKVAFNRLKSGYLSASVRWAMAYAGAVCAALEGASNPLHDTGKRQQD